MKSSGYGLARATAEWTFTSRNTEHIIKEAILVN